MRAKDLDLTLKMVNDEKYHSRRTQDTHKVCNRNFEQRSAKNVVLSEAAVKELRQTELEVTHRKKQKRMLNKATEKSQSRSSDAL